jgi:hypothetical protein
MELEKRIITTRWDVGAALPGCFSHKSTLVICLHN